MRFEKIGKKLDNSNLSLLQQTQAFLGGLAAVLVDKNVFTEKDLEDMIDTLLDKLNN